MDSAGTLWVAFKVSIRGVCMGTQAGVLRDLRHRIRNVVDKMFLLGRDYEQCPSSAVLAQISELALSITRLWIRRYCINTGAQGHDIIGMVARLAVCWHIGCQHLGDKSTLLNY